MSESKPKISIHKIECEDEEMEDNTNPNNAEKTEQHSVATNDEDQQANNAPKQRGRKKVVKQDPKEKFDEVIAICEEVAAKQMAAFQGLVANAKTTADKDPDTLRKRNIKREENDEDQAGETRQNTLIGQPRIITGTMRWYQLDALNWLVNLHKWGQHGILADEMGLGKTLETISLFAQLLQLQIATKVPENKRMKHLVIAPKNALSVWKKELYRWCPSLRTFMLYSEVKNERLELEKLMEQEAPFDVCYTTQEGAKSSEKTLKLINWTYLVVDEAHRIKSEQTQLAKSVRRQTATHRLLITGTPIQNNLHELWALLNFLMPQMFDESDNFDRIFDEMTQNQAKNAGKAKEEINEQAKTIQKIIKPFVLRRIKAEVDKTIPPKKELQVFVGMTSMQCNLQKKMLLKDFSCFSKDNGGTRNRVNDTFTNLRKTTDHPQIFCGIEPEPFIDGPHMWEASEKMRVMDMLLEKLYQKGSRVLIFSQWTSMLDIIDDYCVQKDYKQRRIDGTTISALREEYMDEYNEPGSDLFIFLLTTRAGGVGITLNTADSVILYDSDWNPQADLQAMDRAHRIGQTKQVNVQRLVTEKTCEQRMGERAAIKLKMDHMIVQSGRLAQGARLDHKDVKEFLAFGAQQILKATDGFGGISTDKNIDEILAASEKIYDEEIGAKLKKLEEEFNLEGFNDPNTLEEKMEIFENRYMEGMVDEDLVNQELMDLIDVGTAMDKRERKKKVDIDLNKKWNEIRAKERQQKLAKIKSWRQVLDAKPHHLFDEQRLDVMEVKRKLWEEHLVLKRDADNQNDYDSSEGGSVYKPSIHVNEQAQNGPEEFSEQEKEEYERLKSEGFSSWSKQDFVSFIGACARFGRNQIAAIAEQVGKEEADVRRQADVFWVKYEQIIGWERHIERIENGEKNLLQQNKNLRVADWKINKCPIDEDEEVSYVNPDRKAIATNFSNEEDSLIQEMAQKLNFDNYDSLKSKIVAHPDLKGNWHLRTRTANELRSRVQIMLKWTEKQYDDRNATNTWLKRKEVRQDVDGGSKYKKIEIL